MLRYNGSLMLHYVLAAALSCVLIFSTHVIAAENIASFKTVTGTVNVLHKGSLPALTVKKGDLLSSGDIVRTKSDSSAEVTFNDGSLLKISPRSRIDIGDYFDGQDKNRVSVKLARGKLEAAVTKSPTSGKIFEIQTPNAICGVRGTGWAEKYDVDTNTTEIYVFEGTVYSYNVSDPATVVTVSAGSNTSIVGTTPPRPPTLGTGSFSGAVPFNNVQGTVGGTSPVNTINTQQGTVMATPPPPTPPPPQSHEHFGP